MDTTSIATQEQAQQALNNPTLDPHTLQTIAAKYPDLHTQIQQHPNSYPDLIAWIAAKNAAPKKPATTKNTRSLIPILILLLITVIVLAVILLTLLKPQSQEAKPAAEIVPTTQAPHTPTPTIKPTETPSEETQSPAPTTQTNLKPYTKFQTANKRLSCDLTNPNQIGCTTDMQIPQNCGKRTSVTLDENSPGQRNCTQLFLGQRGDHFPVLNPGETVKNGNITCTLTTQTSVTCENSKTKHGFTISQNDLKTN